MGTIVTIAKAILEGIGLLREILAFWRKVQKAKLQKDTREVFKRLNKAESSDDKKRAARDISKLISRM